MLDAPMLIADARKKPHDLALTPWVRISREEIIANAHPSQRKVRFYAFDIVHLDFVPKFLDDHLLPFASEYAERVNRMQDVIQRSSGTVPSKDWRWSDVKSQ